MRNARQKWLPGLLVDDIIPPLCMQFGPMGNLSAQPPVAATLLLLLTAMAASAQPYSAARENALVRLTDARQQISVAIAPGVGNIAIEMTVKGQNVLRWPYASVDEFKAKPQLSGIPFMGPWANRLDEQAFYANGRRFPFDMELGNVRGTIPIHGFLSYTDQWKVVEAKADASSAWVTSRLEVYRNPLWMAQFPFAHAIEMTYRLQGGQLEVRTRIENLSTEPMPVSIGFHPYFQLTDSPRDEWTISVAARTHWLLAPNKIPTGETQAMTQVFPDPAAAPLKDHDLDHVFSDLVRDSSGGAVMTVKGKSQQLDVIVGPNYRAMVIYAPKPQAGSAQNRNFICFEPMVGITDAMNLAHKGLYKELQSIPPGGTWQESFWIRPRGF
jgi:aldose 1-epimerase